MMVNQMDFSSPIVLAVSESVVAEGHLSDILTQTYTVCTQLLNDMTVCVSMRGYMSLYELCLYCLLHVCDDEV